MISDDLPLHLLHDAYFWALLSQRKMGCRTFHKKFTNFRPPASRFKNNSKKITASHTMYNWANFLHGVYGAD